jgi:endonuclease/exonuclease/phosphatase family metal-dependent hydrolase
VDDLIRRLRHGEFTGGEPIEAFVLLLQEATRRDGTVPPRVPRGYPVPRAIAPHRASGGAGVGRLADQGFAVLYAPSMRNGDRPGADAEDRGNAIVSTLPLLEPRLVELPLERQRRVVAAAAVEGRTRAGARWHIELVSVHLDTALALLRGGPFAARRRQASALLDALSTSGHPPDSHDAIVLAGDLNTWMGDREPAVRILTEVFPDTPTSDRASTWRGPLGLHATLDHIFVSGAVSASHVTRLPSRFGSDHFPLLTIVAF